MTSERAYITVLGRSVWAMVNCYYAVLREEGYHPDVIHVFTEVRFREDMEKGLKALEVLNQRYGISPEIHTTVVDDGDFLSAGSIISDIVRRLRERGCLIALDITPGRKPLVTGALVPAMKHDLEHIYYLDVYDLDGVSRPYMEIPAGKQRLWDFAPRVME